MWRDGPAYLETAPAPVTETFAATQAAFPKSAMMSEADVQAGGLAGMHVNNEVRRQAASLTPDA